MHWASARSQCPVYEARHFALHGVMFIVTFDRAELAGSMDKKPQLRRLREEAPANNFRHVRHRAAALALHLAGAFHLPRE